MPASNGKSHDTCWNVWLRNYEEYCPFLPDKRDVTRRIEVLNVLARAGHSYLFKIQLDGKIYALKLYRLTQPHWRPSRFESNALGMDPFIVEARTYDYLIEKNLNGIVGPRCYGWLTVTKNQAEYLSQKLCVAADWQWRADTAKDPVCGLLLEYIEGTTVDKACLTAEGAQSLRDQLDQLHNLDIAHGDLLPRNIMVSKDGRALLIDFSGALLFPQNWYRMKTKDDVLRFAKLEKSALEFMLFRLQKVCAFLHLYFASLVFKLTIFQLKRHQGSRLSNAQNEEEAYGGPVSDNLSLRFTFEE
ncbi:hypothetical protein LOZ53_004059 [Ophidiomyces ophidiicola]|uniref:uncharacterized protein n=1 Tax=Ophidiomyces ophidiicola TaxID=1387563 RepID=UPI0020C5495F|nr:uncharacterized protein LOZ57_002377 [Ophidiomyces ophidiicola]KAI1949897.1 hypothetical protein LOZ57_002377 [Ophidiomyces ophidiicola]KAI1977889.1 hypothetical protein LOZ55_003116 [Ophidiomyces ophidiicola]KAI1987047.1 hypothetical protein LOZ51_005819 [Ophidiomyces ophidiicola]KAI1988142.1 hypothetical protein LOZ53_004059 [Ophidiomyces ophidiicola]KAI1989035.1 hypothetical protein LOZ54_003041 [Ophidiomyces ophidiicola]